MGIPIVNFKLMPYHKIFKSFSVGVNTMKFAIWDNKII